MIGFPRFFSRQIGRVIPDKSLFQFQTPVFHPFYHLVSDKKLPYVLNYPYRNIKQFESELDYYLKHFQPVSLKDIADPLKTEKPPFHLSFDDGLKECADTIAPILLKKGIPATFFINSGFVDNKELFHRYKASLIYSELISRPQRNMDKVLEKAGLTRTEILRTSISQKTALDKMAAILEIDFSGVLENSKPYLTTDQVLELKEQGFSIGAHSHTHSEFWTISYEEQMLEVKQSLDWLIKNINPEIKAFSFPYTDSGISSKLFKQLSTENICDITFGTAGIKQDEYKTHFQRYPAEKYGDFKLNLKEEFVYFKLRKLMGKGTVTR